MAQLATNNAASTVIGHANEGQIRSGHMSGPTPTRYLWEWCKETTDKAVTLTLTPKGYRSTSRYHGHNNGSERVVVDVKLAVRGHVRLR